MAIAEAVAPKALVGHAQPRIAPPIPARSDIGAFRQTAADVGITLMPWQETAARYLTAQASEGRHLYREVAIVVARQNGKTTLLIPLIVAALRAGRRIMHTAQDRALPREVFYAVADIMSEDTTLFPQRNGRPTRPRFANGQEEIRLANGGVYSIVAPTRGGARGPSRDLVIVDEARELDDWQFIAAAKPTMTASPDPQMVYLSNAGDETSIVLNALRDRSGKDPSLAYLEWSAAPERATDDRTGWAESNPAIGHMPAVIETLDNEHRTNRLAGTLNIFETEHLCRWVLTMRQPLVAAAAWNLCEAEPTDRPRRAYMGVSMAPEGTRAAAALAWQQSDGTVAMRLLFDVTGSPIDPAALGADLRREADRRRVAKVAFDPMTDAELAKFFRVTEPVNGQKFSNASNRFVNLVEAHQLRWSDAAGVSDDLTWTSRKENDETGSYQAVRANDDRPIPAALAAIRAVWLASGPRTPSPRIY